MPFFLGFLVFFTLFEIFYKTTKCEFWSLRLYSSNHLVSIKRVQNRSANSGDKNNGTTEYHDMHHDRTTVTAGIENMFFAQYI